MLPDYQAFVEAHAQPAPVSIRVNSRKKYVANENWQAVAWSEAGYYLPVRPAFALDPLWHAGAYYVQEASSMFLEHILKTLLPTLDKPVALDLCAAPGGKSVILSDALPQGSLLIANEIIRTRANILAENLIKRGRGNAIVTNNDPKDFEQLPDFFDVMLIDAPCSGEGMFRKDPEAVQEWSEYAVSQCALRQKQILSQVWGSLREEGYLIYSTCTYNRTENEEILEWLCETHHAESIKIALPPDWHIEKSVTPLAEGYRFFPQRLAGEGLFMAVLQKKERSSRSGRKPPKPVLTLLSKKEKETVGHFVIHPEGGDWAKFQEKVLFLPADTRPLAEKIFQKLWVVHAGVQVAEFFHHKINPSESLALFDEINTEIFENQALDLPVALAFLRKEEIEIREGSQGWVLVSYENTPLGWVKKSGNKTTNHYPKEWRLRLASPV